MKTDNAFLGLFMKYKIYRMNFSLTIIACLLLIAYLLAVGVAMLALGKGLFVYTASIGDDCAGGACRLAVRVRRAVPLPVVVYVGFENFHLNHRKAMQSISMDQLSPEEDAVDDLADCAGYATNADAARFYPRLFGGLAPEDEIKPCGLRPLLYRNCALNRQRVHHARAQLRAAAARRRQKRLPAQAAGRALRLPGRGLLDRLPRPFAHQRSSSTSSPRRSRATSSTRSRSCGRRCSPAATTSTCASVSLSAENAKLANVTSYLTLRQLGPFGGRHLYLAYANLVVAYVLLLTVLMLLFLNKEKLPKRTRTL